jgi:hypothetical protein
MLERSGTCKHYLGVACICLLNYAASMPETQAESMEIIEATGKSKGGVARAQALSKEERSRIAKKGAEARWSADLPQATHDGPLQIGDMTLVAAVLESGKRLLSQGTFLQALGRSRTPKAGTGGFSTVDGLPFFLQAEVLRCFITEDLLMSTTPILFRLKNGQRTVGYDADLLPLVCQVYQSLHRSLTDRMASKNAAEANKAKSTYNRYKHIIEACDRLIAGFGQRGIRAMVDDATGYQADRAKEDALKIVEAFISPQLMPWTRRFPHEFFRMVYGLYGWEYKAGAVKHPRYLGMFIRKYVYGQFPNQVMQELDCRNPMDESGRRKNKQHQYLTVDIGHPVLDRAITVDMTLLQLAQTPKHFDELFNRAIGAPYQTRLLLTEPEKQTSL